MTTRAHVAPPVDLNKPVTNPRLVAAIEKHQRIRSNETAVELLRELKASVLLVGAILEKPLPRASNSQALFKKGDKIGFIEVRDDAEKRLLGLFTDQGQLQRFTGQANSSFVMPAKQAMEFVIEKGYDGLVVNPSGPALLRLDTTFIRRIAKDM